MAQRFAPRVAAVAALPLAVVAAAAVSACSVGAEAGTLNEAPITGARADAGLVKIRNALVVAPAEIGGDATLSVTIVNDGTTDDALVDVEIAGTAEPVAVTMRPSTIELPAETATRIPTGTRPSAVLDADTLAVGTYTRATFSFANAGSVELSLLVVAPVGWWTDLTGVPADDLR